MLARHLLPVLSCSLLTLSAAAQQSTLRVVDAAETGCDADALHQAARTFGEVVGVDRDVLGAVVLVARGDAIVLHEALGFRDVDGTLPMQKHTLFRMASNTKAVTAAAILALADDGKLALDDHVSKYLPTFGVDEAAAITVRHLLTHSSGLRIPTLFVLPLTAKSPEHPDAPNLVFEAARFGEIGPKVEPGTSYSYSNPGYNTLAAIVEVVSGQPFATFCQRRFYEPLGMTDSCHHESVADNARMAMVVKKGEKGAWRVMWRPGGAATVPFVRGSGGMISTAADFTRFCRMLLDDGRCGDRQLLSKAMARATVRNQIEHIEGARYGFGWVADGDGVFSHGGSDGTWAWCDARRDLVGIVFTQTQGSARLEQARKRFREQVTAACPPQ